METVIGEALDREPIGTKHKGQFLQVKEPGNHGAAAHAQDLHTLHGYPMSVQAAQGMPEQLIPTRRPVQECRPALRKKQQTCFLFPLYSLGKDIRSGQRCAGTIPFTGTDHYRTGTVWTHQP